MTMSKKQRHDLKSALKRRERRPEPLFVPPTNLTVTTGERNRITRSSPGILLSIETLFINSWKSRPQIDDTDIERTLICAIRRLEETEREHVQTLIKDLNLLHDHWIGQEETEETWNLALRVVLQSVQTHSDGLPGSRNYLNFTTKFLADFKRKSRVNL